MVIDHLSEQMVDEVTTGDRCKTLKKTKYKKYNTQ